MTGTGNGFIGGAGIEEVSPAPDPPRPIDIPTNILSMFANDL